MLDNERKTKSDIFQSNIHTYTDAPSLSLKLLRCSQPSMRVFLRRTSEGSWLSDLRERETFRSRSTRCHAPFTPHTLCKSITNAGLITVRAVVARLWSRRRLLLGVVARRCGGALSGDHPGGWIRVRILGRCRLGWLLLLLLTRVGTWTGWRRWLWLSVLIHRGGVGRGGGTGGRRRWTLGRGGIVTLGKWVVGLRIVTP